VLAADDTGTGASPPGDSPDLMDLVLGNPDGPGPAAEQTSAPDRGPKDEVTPNAIAALRGAPLIEAAVRCWWNTWRRERGCGPGARGHGRPFAAGPLTF